MSYLKEQLQLTIEKILGEIEEINPELFDIQPKGFNNTIRWHIGHILTVNEIFLFGYPKKGNLPADYIQHFGKGSKPSDWGEDVPSIEVLTLQLKEQLNRIPEIPEEHFAEKLPKPFLNKETFGELAIMSSFHAAFHLGQIHAMKRVINTAN